MYYFKYKFRNLYNLLIFIGFEICENSYNCFFNYNGYVFSAYIEEYGDDESLDVCCLSKFVNSKDYQDNREMYRWVKLLALTSIGGEEHFEISYFEEERGDNMDSFDYEKKIMDLLKKVFIKEIRKNKIKNIVN